MTFKVHEYSLMRDVAHSLQRPRCPQQVFLHHPLVVMNQFNARDHLKLVSVGIARARVSLSCLLGGLTFLLPHDVPRLTQLTHSIYLPRK